MTKHTTTRASDALTVKLTEQRDEARRFFVDAVNRAGAAEAKVARLEQEVADYRDGHIRWRTEALALRAERDALATEAAELREAELRRNYWHDQWEKAVVEVAELREARDRALAHPQGAGIVSEDTTRASDVWKVLAEFRAAIERSYRGPSGDQGLNDPNLALVQQAEQVLTRLEQENEELRKQLEKNRSEGTIMCVTCSHRYRVEAAEAERDAAVAALRKVLEQPVPLVARRIIEAALSTHKEQGS